MMFLLAPWPPDADSRIEQAGADICWYPEVGRGRTFDDVPDAIADTADEAYRYFSIGAHRGALQLARAVIEATAKEKDITTGDLRKKIDAMVDANLIRRHIAAGAHEIRYFGNSAAHGDPVNPADQADVSLILTLMDEVLLEVFQSPARVERAREARRDRASSTVAQ